MCFVTIEDYTDQMEITVFPRLFYQCMNALVPDRPVVIQGKADTKDDTIKILADKVWSMDEYNPEYYLMPRADDKQAVTAIKEVMAKHHGNNAVYIYQGRWQKLGEEFWLDNEPETLTLLENILGAQGVKKR